MKCNKGEQRMERDGANHAITELKHIDEFKLSNYFEMV